MMKRLIAIVAALVLMVTCASCGGGSTTSDGVSDAVTDGVRTVCASCGRERGDGFAFCPYCGAAEARTVCASCDQELAGNFAFCPHCGASTSGVTTDEGSSDTDTASTTAGGTSSASTANKNTAATNKGGASDKNTAGKQTVCASCKRELAGNYAFCPHCGGSVTGKATNKGTASTDKGGSANKGTASTNKGGSANKGTASTNKVNSTVSSSAGGSSASSNSANGGGNSSPDSGSSNHGGSNHSQVANPDGLMYSDNVEVFKNIPAELVGETVLFSDFGEAVADEYQKVIAKFTTDTGIKVKMIQFLNSEYIIKVSQQIAAGKSPDIAVCNSTFPAALEMVQKLPSMFDVNDGFWDKRVSEATKVKGQYYFVNTINSPFTGGYAVYYNKKLFNSAGIKTPQEYVDEGKWTWENFKRAARDCSMAGYKGAMFDPIILAQQMGPALIEYDSATGTFSGNANSPEFIKAMQYYTNGLADGAFTSGSAQAFANGGIGIAITGTHGLKYNGYFKDLLPSDIGVLPCPNSYEGKTLNVMPLGYRGYGICKGAYNIKGAYYLLRYFLDLDKYEPAGANIFVNRSLEKYFRQKQLVQFQNSPLRFAYFEGVLPLTGKGWSTGIWDGVKYTTAGQIAVELAKKKDILNTAADAGNRKIRDFT